MSSRTQVGIPLPTAHCPVKHARAGQQPAPKGGTEELFGEGPQPPLTWDSGAGPLRTVAKLGSWASGNHPVPGGPSVP